LAKSKKPGETFGLSPTLDMIKQMQALGSNSYLVGSLGLKSYVDLVGSLGLKPYAGVAKSLGSKSYVDLVGSLGLKPYAGVAKSLGSNSYADLVGSLGLKPYADLAKSLGSNSYADLVGSLGLKPYADLAKSLGSNSYADLVGSLGLKPYADLAKSLGSNSYADLLKSLRSNPLAELMGQLRQKHVSDLIPPRIGFSPFSARALAGLAQAEGSLGQAIRVISDAIEEAIREIPNDLPENEPDANVTVEAMEFLPADVERSSEIRKWARGLRGRLRDLAKRHPHLLGIVLSIISNLIYDGLKWYADPFLPVAIQAEEYREKKKELRRALGVVPTEIRIVSKDQTRVWRDRRRARGFAFRLPRGQIVVLLEKRGKWSRIGFGDLLGQSSEVGWVKNKYLDRLDAP